MNKKIKIVIIILLLSVLLLSVFLLFISKKGKEGNNILHNNEAPNYVNVKDEKNYLLHKNVVFKSDCKNISDDNKRLCLDFSYRDEVGSTKNMYTCLKISNYKMRNQCIYQQVRELGDIDFCRRIADKSLIEGCIGDIGISKSDPKYCDILNNEPYEYNECVDRIKALKKEEYLNINECADIKTLEYSSLCLERAVKKGDSCNNIVDVKLKNKCLDNIAFNKAVSVDDCKMIKDRNHYNVCLKKVHLSLQDYEKIDSDSDGIMDYKEIWFNTDPFNSDTDNDDLNDYKELIEYKTNPLHADTDNDGLNDGAEIKAGTDIQKTDSDLDGIFDGLDSDPFPDDNDKDGLINIVETMLGTDPNNVDTDGDGESDGVEFDNGKNPVGQGHDRDTDGDGLKDIDELFYLTNGLNPDTDGDGINDFEEIQNKTNPIGIGDFDFDSDGLSDKDELKLGTNPTLFDTNGDGLNDQESIRKSINAVSNDTDKDSLFNKFEIETTKTNPLNSDTDNDGLSDGDEIRKYFTDPLKENNN